jgi:hypothetical protein
MLETPPCPYLITTDNGCPVLLFGPELQQLQQEVKPRTDAPSSSPAVTSDAGSAASGSFTAEVAAAFAGDSCSEPQIMLQQGPCSSRCGSCSDSGSSSSSSKGGAGGAATAAGGAGGKPPLPTAARSLRHVAFSASTRSLNALEGQHQRSFSFDAAAASDQPNAAAVDLTCRASLMANSDPLPQLLLPGNATQQQQQQQQHWQPLTTSALRRMSVDSSAYSGPGSSCIPLALQLPGPGSSRSVGGSTAFARVAVPSAVLQRASSAAAGGGGGSDSGVAAGLGARSQSGGCYDDVSDILAAANMERDYEVRWR